MKAYQRQASPEAFPESGTVPVRIKLLYGVGQIPNAVKGTLFGIFTLFFYTTVMGLSGTLVGIAVAAGLVWDAVIDPAIGTLSDNAQWRLGRRHGFMLAGSAGMGISFWAYFSPPDALSGTGLFVWLLVTNILVRTTASVFTVPYFALGAELSSDYHERTSVTGFRGFFALMGTMAAAGLAVILFFPTLEPGVDPKSTINGYYLMGLSGGLTMIVFGLASTFGTFSCRRTLPHEAALHSRKSGRIFFRDIMIAVRNRSFRSIFLSYSTFYLGTVINATLAIHFVTYYTRITQSTLFSAFQFSFYGGALLGIVFWLRLSRTVEKRWLYFFGTLCTALLMGCAFILLGEGRVFGTGNIGPLCAGHAAAGFFASVLWMIPGSMIADIADEDQLLTGQRREGVFFGMFQMGEQLAAGAAVLITGVLLDRFAGLVPGQSLQTPETVNRIGMLYSLLPSALLVVAALSIAGYGLSEKKVAQIQVQLKGMSERL